MLLAGHATVSATAVGYSLDAYLLGADLHCYHVTMTYSTPVAADTVEVVIPSATFSDYSDYDGSYQFIGASEDETYEVGFNYFSSTITGSFTWADCDASYSGLYVNGTSLSVYSAEFTVTEVEGGYQVEAYVLCTDNHCYHVMMFYSAEGINTANQVQVKHRCHRRCRPYRPQQYPECQHAQHKWSVQRCLHATHRHHRGRQHPEDYQEVISLQDNFLSSMAGSHVIRPCLFFAASK